ncbi:MAG: discoidin domain-containing protein, partial [Kiritimatiellales bacterium]
MDKNLKLQGGRWFAEIGRTALENAPFQEREGGMKKHVMILFSLLLVAVLSGCVQSEPKAPLSVDTEASTEWALQLACLAADSNPSTFWLPESEEESYLLIDLCTVQSVECISFDWYPAKECTYVLDVSEDGDRWRTIVTGKIRDSDISQVVFDEPVLAQYLMIRQRG